MLSGTAATIGARSALPPSTSLASVLPPPSTTGDVQRVLGRPPITFDQFLTRNAALFQ